MNDFKNPEGYADPTAYHAIKKIQGENMEKGTVIKYRDNRGNETLMVTLGSDGEVVTGITLMPTRRSGAVPVCGLYASPERIRYMYINSIPDYEVAMYASDDDLTALLTAVAGYIGLEIVSDKEMPVEDEKPVKTDSAVSDARVIQLETEARIYKAMYESLLAKVTA